MNVQPNSQSEALYINANRYIAIMGFGFQFLGVMLGQKLGRLPSFSLPGIKHALTESETRNSNRVSVSSSYT